MSEGTSLDDIESGTIQHEADQAAMHAIMSDMNATEPDMSRSATMQPMQSIQPMQSMQPMQQMQPMHPMDMRTHDPIQERFTAQYEPIEPRSNGERDIKEPTILQKTLKRNGWAQLFDQLRDALIVGLMVCFFSLPALHTLVGKRLSWAYKVGGSMSWIGFLLLFVVSAGSYSLYQGIVKKIGL